MRLLDRMIRRYGDTFWEGQASGAAILTTTYGSPDREALSPQFTQANIHANASNGIVFGAIAARMTLFSEARFQYQSKTDKHLYGNQTLQVLENPFGPNTTTGELLVRMEQDVSLAGNSYIADVGDQLVRLRPDWVTIVSEMVPMPTGPGTYRRVAGYWFEPPVPERDAYGMPQMFPVDEVVHWAPIPDPEAQFRGMSWLTPVLREVNADNALTSYKLKYLQNAATPNIILRYTQKLQPATIDAIRERMAARYGGVDNAFKTLVLDQGADMTVVGHSLEQMSFATVQAAGENRILVASRVPGIVVGSKEGLMAATYSNYQQAMRSFVDLFARPQWRSACAALEKLVPVPAGSRLWFDVGDVSALRQGEQEQAQTALTMANAIAMLCRFGYDPMSSVAAVQAGDMTLLTHKGLPVDILTYVPKGAPPALTLPFPDAGDTSPSPGQDPSDPGAAASALANGSQPAGLAGGNN